MSALLTLSLLSISLSPCFLLLSPLSTEAPLCQAISLSGTLCFVMLGYRLEELDEWLDGYPYTELISTHNISQGSYTEVEEVLDLALK